MRKNSLVKDTWKFLKNLIKRWEGKQKEYNSTVNPFYSFESAIGISFHNQKEKVLWEYMTKHLQSVKDLIEEKERISTKVSETKLKKEQIDEKIGDIILYLCILRGMLLETSKSKEK
jgi:hypothetical protein